MSVSVASDSPRTARSRTEWWLGEVDLVQRLQSAGTRTRTVLGREFAIPEIQWDVAWRAPEIISVLTHACLDELRCLSKSAVTRAQQICDLIMDLQRLAMDWYLHDTAIRGERLAECAAGLARLRTLPSSAALTDSVCEELVLRCGFHRAVLSKVESRTWKPLIIHHRSGNETQPWFADWINQRVPLTDTAPEAEMLSRRRPTLVYDTSEAPVYRPLIVQAGQSRSYALAPLVVGGDVVGFLHTDHHPLPRRVDESDRDVLWAFADGFSHIYERAMLIEQLRAQRDGVRELFFGVVDRLDELCETTSERKSRADARIAEGSPATVKLTERESQVLELMVAGASNQAIAARLVITEGTAKSHVKHILRKYGALNRAQVIAWALADR